MRKKKSLKKQTVKAVKKRLEPREMNIEDGENFT